MVELSLIQKIAIWALPLIFGITLHEVAHGWVASLYGDQTARLSGRLTLNPIKHIDPVGTILLPMLMLTFSNFIFGWAKPVPVDARNMRNPRWNMAVVALAGPVSNLLMALLWGAIAKFGVMATQSGQSWYGVPLALMGEAGITINVVLAVLNLIPLPPLDGGRVAVSVLPRRVAYHYSMIEPYGFLIIVLMLISGILSSIMLPPVYFLLGQISGLFGL